MEKTNRVPEITLELKADKRNPWQAPVVEELPIAATENGAAVPSTDTAVFVS